MMSIRRLWRDPDKLRTFKVSWVLMLRLIEDLLWRLKLKDLAMKVDGCRCDFELDNSMTHGEYSLLTELRIYWRIGGWSPWYEFTEEEREELIQQGQWVEL